MDAVSSLGIVSTVAGLVGTVILGWKWAVKRYKETLGSRQELREKILLLACGETHDYVNQLFGMPAMQFDQVANAVQHAYWLKHAWVSTLSEADEDAIFAFSVTITDPRFTLPTQQFTSGQLGIKLGVSRYSDAAIRPHGWRYIQGAHTVEYCEYYYFGNLSYYQTYALASSTVGVREPSMTTLFRSTLPATVGHEFGAEDWISDSNVSPPEPLRTFRLSARPNTFVVIGADVKPHVLEAWQPIGLAYDRVRMFPKLRNRKPPPRDRRFAKAQKAAERLARDRGHSEAGQRGPLQLGKFFAEQGDVEGAKAAYRLAINSGDPVEAGWGADNLGDLLVEQDDAPGAAAAYRIATDIPNTGAEVGAAVKLGGLLAADHDFAGAEAAYRAAMEHEKTGPAAWAAYRLGNLLAEQGQVASAADAYRTAIEAIDPIAAVKAARSLGDLMIEQDDMTGAKAAYQVAVQSGQPDAAAWASLKLGNLLAGRDDVAAAKTAYEIAIGTQDSSAAGWAACALGDLLTGQGDLVGAKAAYRKAVNSANLEAAERATRELQNQPPERKGGAT